MAKQYKIDQDLDRKVDGARDVWKIKDMELGAFLLIQENSRFLHSLTSEGTLFLFSPNESRYRCNNCIAS